MFSRPTNVRFRSPRLVSNPFSVCAAGAAGANSPGPGVRMRGCNRSAFVGARDGRVPPTGRGRWRPWRASQRSWNRRTLAAGSKTGLTLRSAKSRTTHSNFVHPTSRVPRNIIPTVSWLTVSGKSSRPLIVSLITRVLSIPAAR